MNKISLRVLQQIINSTGFRFKTLRGYSGTVLKFLLVLLWASGTILANSSVSVSKETKLGHECAELQTKLLKNIHLNVRGDAFASNRISVDAAFENAEAFGGIISGVHMRLFVNDG